uniref:DUF4592 domain-containing protein n=2 Tax=Monopterus albus TaxID=43700 RepID=A0A3Q3JEA7_MONAL
MDVMEEKKTAEEAIEEEKDDAEEMTEWFPDAAAEEVEVAMLPQEVDEGVDVVVGDDTVYTAKHTDDDDEEKPDDDDDDDEEMRTEPDDEEFTIVHECQTNYSHSSADGEERAEEVVEIEHTEQKSDQEEDEEANQPVADETEQGMEQESVEMSHLDLEDMENDQTEAPEQAVVSAKPPSLSLPTSHFDTQPQESGAITPSKISTTTLHINLVSPSSEKATSFFQKSPITAEPKENSAVSGKQSTASTEEEQADCAEEVEEEAPPPASVVEVVSQPSRSSDHSKVRFTIAPVWQRSHSLTPPSSPSACVPSSPSAATGPGDEEVGAASTKDPAVEAQPTGSAKAELVLSPSKTRNAGSSTAKPQDSAADIEESSVIVEGNPDNPFGVRLRKTPVLHRLSSEEESPSEPLIQPTICKAEPPQPTGVKPLINQPNGNKPALPKKPDVHGDSGGKTKCISGPAIGCGVSGGSDSPSWISVARQKQMIYKDNSLDEITVKKEGQERKSSLPVYISSAASRQQSSHTAESANKVSPLEISKPPESLEKDTRRALAPPTPVPPQPLKSQLLPCPVSPKPPSQPYPASRTLSPPTPVPRKSSSSPSPPSLSKCATFVPSSKTNEPQDMVLTSSPFSDRTALEKSGTRAPGLSGQTSSSQRGLPPPALPQDEPPWMALAKKKAKAWSEMPQIVQ